jgi:undecaprenyl phosphate N,N'-diacetylbacillosamine 1-phosphate transferase
LVIIHGFFNLKNMYIHIKILLDTVFSLFCLIIFSPLFLALAICIKFFDPGPVFFRQKRVGKAENIFLIYKFRTMVVNADKIGPVLTAENDPRITRLGRFLRRTSLDELPQLINIVKGEMSLIGPRPEVPSIVETYGAEQRKVFKVKPGLTGWAQVHGRDDLSIEEKSVYDLQYIEKVSFMLDLKIFLLTFPALLSARGTN